MDSYVVKPAGALEGNVTISGAKNAVLPLIAASLLCKGVSRIHNVPHLKDVSTMCQVLQALGAKTQLQNNTLIIDSSTCTSVEAPYELVKTMRASIYVLGPLLARFGLAKVSLPGGCAWGPRPVDLHLMGIKALGANVDVEQGYIQAAASSLTGADITFPISSVGATANILMASVLAKGKTRLFNAAMEPEIDNLVDHLLAMGAKIEGKGSSNLIIEGVEQLQPTEISAIPDRIEAGTFMLAAAMTQGHIRLNTVFPKHLKAVINKLIKAGVRIKSSENWIEVDARDRKLKPVSVTTSPYPGFPTDLQPQWMAFSACLKGASQIKEGIYSERFKHIPELVRLGAKIRQQGVIASVIGGNELSGAQVMAADLRAGAALVLAGLIAQGETQVSRIYHIDRGYEALDTKLQGLGAKVYRVSETFQQETVLAPVA